ncbi:MAG: hypothetical protein AB7O24_31635 [Kofleriaceae bacterium]
MPEPLTTSPSKKPSLRERLAVHVSEYGRLAIWTYLVLSLSTIAGFSVAIGAGLQPSSATGIFGVIGAGWVAAKATMPIRILATLAVTPVVAAVIRRRRPPSARTAELDT